MLQRGCAHELSETGERLGHLCLAPPSTKTIPDASTAERIWREYTIVTTVRNPFSRGASAYTYLLKRRTEQNTHTKYGCHSPRFLNFCMAPYLIGLQSQKYDCIDNKVHDYHHVEFESSCLVNSQGEFVVDHILSVESLNDDWREFVEEYGLRENRSVSGSDQYFEVLKGLQVRHVNAVSTQKSYGSEIFQKCGQTCVYGLAQYYKKDFEILGYENCMF